MDTHKLAMALCGACFCLAVANTIAVCHRGNELKHFTAVRFRVPPGAVVTVNGRTVTPTVYLNSHAEYTVLVRHGDHVLLSIDGYRPPLAGAEFDLVPRLEVAPPPRPVGD